MRVKICGITTAADGVAAAEAGADAIGLNFVGGPRKIELSVAREIVPALPPLVTPVALVRIEQGQIPQNILEFLHACRVSHVQIYGYRPGESSAPQNQPPGSAVSDAHLQSLSAAGFRVMPVVTVKDPGFAEPLCRWGTMTIEHRPAAVVLDAYDPTREGGTGRTFQWEWVLRARQAGAGTWPPVILAGGLTPDNVAEAIQVVRPYGVDVSSGVEIDGSPGKKDPDKLIAFVRSARRAIDANAH